LTACFENYFKIVVYQPKKNTLRYDLIYLWQEWEPSLSRQLLPVLPGGV
jgi:hypothetical protein